MMKPGDIESKLSIGAIVCIKKVDTTRTALAINGSPLQKLIHNVQSGDLIQVSFSPYPLLNGCYRKSDYLSKITNLRTGDVYEGKLAFTSRFWNVILDFEQV